MTDSELRVITMGQRPRFEDTGFGRFGCGLGGLSANIESGEK